MRRRERIEVFVREIWRWYDRKRRPLPWRNLETLDETQRAYRIIVSEVMLQQTQVPRVTILYKRFLRRFPTLHSLAKASNRDVLLAWRGMGYNSRALRLRDAAKAVVENYGGKFPRSMEALQALPGIGQYTAAAIRNFAFGTPTPCLDTNIRRVLHRVFVGPENLDGTWRRDDQYLLKLAENVLEAALEWKVESGKWNVGKATAEWHHALMDFGSLVQTKTKPQWDQCPLARRRMCLAALRWPKRSSHKLRIKRREPGRVISGRFIPNRIIRGRIVEALRDALQGLTLSEIGKRVCSDWDPKEHQRWLRELLAALVREEFVEERGRRFVLRD